MPLIKSILKTEIVKITDASNPIHEGFPASIEEAGQRWAEAIDKYASQIIPFSSTSQIAKQQLAVDLINVQNGGTSVFITVLTNYAIELSSGMSPTFTGTPPPIPIVLQPIFNLGFKGETAENIAELLSNVIDAWFRTGTAINVSSSITTNWN